MNAARDAWKEVGSRVEALGLKLKLHLEQEHDHEVADRERGDTHNAFEELGEKVSEAFDAFGKAARDEAVKSDVREIASLIKEALVDTLHAVGAEVGEVVHRVEGTVEETAEKLAGAVRGGGDSDGDTAAVIDVASTEVSEPEVSGTEAADEEE